MYVAARVDNDKCSGCKVCIFTCPDPNVIKLNKEAKIVAINEARCKGCGLCVVACPKKALNVSS
ncbi:4Fe-4S binding protein [Dethiobacter alkaliphilus]|uniref:4Fe-4S ferredoxin iron-sulfur binding domain protein n=1 Tax=Dethiobacter alkaliphilus AHT 1 TaxID=555088 RepID=C0GC14_DETAL|nr:4Fe-4S binding protein [Dethiobacter alkaliphilus]EEG78749.1 4Fe-4S ferredoxin iron-sulfur binding domain protein [Dethiobacter alkaliphilus AHT 1]MCW3489376.1 4Fe-4S binding protein [Dethiobacter alkaliphilus]